MKISRCLIALAIVAQGSASLASGADAKELFFEQKIRPFLVENCLECHEQGYAENGLLWESRELALEGGENGPAIVPGDPAKSLMIAMVKGEAEGLKQMPPKKTLTAEQIADLEKWIADGAVWPTTDGDAIKRDPFDHWSYRPLQQVSPPTVEEPEWSGTAVDRFIRAKQVEEQLTSTEKADPLVLLRRLKFDLLGLPPTPEEVAEVSERAESEEEWFVDFVDRFLESPHYGERWGRHWMDVVRYADTNGSIADLPLDEAWRYRNYVIDAFNDDMPYDQFIHEQIAGDLINEEEGLSNPLRGIPRYVDRPPFNPETHIGMLPEPKKLEREGPRSDQPLTEDQKRRYIATGYLALSRTFGTEHSLYPLHLTLDDTIGNLGRSFFALSYDCARCHDHKFDAVSSEDYYGLYGIFASTRYTWSGVELAPHPRDMIPLIPDAEHAAITGKVAKATGAQRRKVFNLWKDWQAAWENEKANPDDTGAAKEQLEKRTFLWTASKTEGRLRMEAQPDFESAYGVVDADAIGEAAILVKGDPTRLGDIVPRQLPEALGGTVLPEGVRDSTSGRLELARFMTDTEKPAGWLTARVMVNRIWMHHFGQGFMLDPNDFGVRGGEPTHPELLDYLAQRFIDSGWSIKALHREILDTRVWRLASAGDAANLEVDPTNQYLWKQNIRRMDAESLRDSLLSVSGLLDPEPMEQPHPFNPLEKRTEYTQHHPFEDSFPHYKRSVYLMTKRMKQDAYFASFDGPDRALTTGKRGESVTSQQALFMLNNKMVHETADELAESIGSGYGSVEEKIDLAYRQLLGRPATQSEIALGQSMLEQSSEDWASYCRALIRTNEFIYIN